MGSKTPPPPKIQKSNNHAFISYVPGIHNQDQIKGYLRIPLANIGRYLKDLSPWETSRADIDNLRSFTMEGIKIKSLYHIETCLNRFGTLYWVMLAKISHEETTYFMKYCAFFFNTIDRFCGVIVITKFPSFFANHLVEINQRPARIHDILKQENHHSPFSTISADCYPALGKISPMSLRQLCISDITRKPQCKTLARDSLPRHIRKEIKDWLRVKKWMRRHKDKLDDLINNLLRVNFARTEQGRGRN